LTSHRTYTEQSQQDKLDAATIYSMLENEIIPLYFAKNSKGYSPLWVQYIKNSIGHIAPNYTMSRMLKDYIDKFYAPEAARAKKLVAKDYALAKEIAAWKENVAAHWDDVKLVGEIQHGTDALINHASDNRNLDITLTLDTAGLGKDVKVELVVYKDADGNTKFHHASPFELVGEDGDKLTYRLKGKIKYSGIFRFAFRAYPWNKNLPHRQDFAYLKWF